MRAILSIILIVQVLLGSINFNGEMHFCGDVIKDVALFGKANSCNSSSQKPNESQCSIGLHKEGFNKGNCCKDRKFSIQGISSDYENNDFYSFSENKDLEATLYYEKVALIGFLRFPSSNFRLNLYEPPVAFRNLFTLFDSFLI